MRLSNSTYSLACALVAISSFNANAQTWIADSDAQIVSKKRGVGANALSAADFRALAPGLGWYYTWGSTPLTKPADVTSMAFVPMAWNADAGFKTGMQSYLAAGNRPPWVFFCNEPNLVGQATMTPPAVAQLFFDIAGISSPYGIRAVGPHMALGTPPESSITAFSCTQNQMVTYTFQQPFLTDFLCETGPTQPTGMATHPYGNYGELWWISNEMRNAWPDKTVFMTELNLSGSPSLAASLDHLIKAVDYMERTTWVEGYAWFKERLRRGDPNSLLLPQSGKLTDLGRAYVAMPVHDANLYYRIGVGRQLQAERYAASAAMTGTFTPGQTDIAPTTDTSGLADMISSADGASLEYQIQVPASGTYTLRVRASGTAGPVSLYNGTTLLGTVNLTGTSWATPSTSVALPAGLQKIRLVFGKSGQRVNWLSF
jgi:hypothetical protein